MDFRYILFLYSRISFQVVIHSYMQVGPQPLQLQQQLQLGAAAQHLTPSQHLQPLNQQLSQPQQGGIQDVNFIVWI